MTALRERGSEVATFDRALGDLVEGVGRCIVVEGPAGIGKTRLLAVARDRARDLGLRVLRARGSELERSAPFGLVHQLLDVTVHRATAAERESWFEGAASLAGPVFEVGGSAAAPSDLYPTLHGLYWLLASIIRDEPTVLVCDDLQWADDPSLALLEFLTRRIEDVPLLLVLGTRPRRPAARCSPRSRRIRRSASCVRRTSAPMRSTRGPARRSRASPSRHTCRRACR